MTELSMRDAVSERAPRPTERAHQTSSSSCSMISASLRLAATDRTSKPRISIASPNEVSLLELSHHGDLLTDALAC